MFKNKNEIIDSFRTEMRIFELYHDDIQESINSLNQQANDFDKYLKEGGSIAVESTAITKSDGKVSFTVGVEDNPQTREVLSFATEKRINQLQLYIEISLKMALSHLITIFDAKFLDLVGIYYEANPQKLDGLTLERKLMNFAYKPFKNQIASISQNIRIDLTKILGDNLIEELVEIRETRNLVVHNLCMISESYLNKVKNSQFNLGDKRPISAVYLKKAIDLHEHFFYEFSSNLKTEHPTGRK